MQTEPHNQWVASGLLDAVRITTAQEIERRNALNEHMMRGVKLSVKPDRVYRDILAGLLRMAAPAGVA